MAGQVWDWRVRGWLVTAMLLLGLFASMGAPLRADPFLPASSDDLPGLTVRLEDGQERSLSIQELESAGIRHIRTTSPWEIGQIDLEGPLLRDVLAMVGLAKSRRILIRAKDDYISEIPLSDWRDYPVILATRLGGRPLGQRQKGPTRIVYPLLDHPELSTPDRQGRWIWLIASIEASR